MRVWLRRLYAALVLLIGLVLLALNLRLYQSPEAGLETIEDHLQFQKDQLESGSAERMQAFFPEGYFFSYCLYGASWVDLGLRYPEAQAKALKEARWALSALEGEKGKAPFQGTSEPPLGVFYRGWTNWLRGGVVRLAPAGPEADIFRSECELLGKAFAQSESPYLDAYPGQAWPCDSTVAVASLALHDAIFEPRYGQLLKDWLSKTGPELFPHQARPVLTASRGTSQVMIQRFLFEIDPELAGEQYRKFRAQYVTTRFGLPGVREYPLGQEGEGDVDSGPLIFGFSFSATGVMPGAARLHQDERLLQPFGQLIQTFGFPLGGRYLGGEVPVADALLVWSRTATSWTGKTPAQTELEPVVSPLWRWGFHAFWLVLWLVLAAPLATKWLGRPSLSTRTAPDSSA